MESPSEEPRRPCACPGCDEAAEAGGYWCSWHWDLLPQAVQRALAECYEPGLLAGDADAPAKWDLAMALARRYLAALPWR